MTWLEDLRLDVVGPVIVLRGRSKGRTLYTISVEGPLKDTYGQVLKQPAKVKQQVSRAVPVLFDERRPMQILDPAFKPDSPERSRLYQEMTKLILAYAPWMLHVHHQVTHLVNPWGQGLQEAPLRELPMALPRHRCGGAGAGARGALIMVTGCTRGI